MVWFRSAFEKDSKYLVDKGLEKMEIDLMIDYVLLT
jgi:hypothetical protein